MKKINTLTISAKNKCAYSGYQLYLNAKYKVKLTEIKPIFDLFTKSDFAGWLNIKGGIKQKFHDFVQSKSRFPEAKIFSLIGHINDVEIDLGKLWSQSGKKEFEVNLKEYFENNSSKAKLFVYFNDVNYFYWNNRGSYQIEIKE